MAEFKYVIWQNYNLNLEDYEDYLQEEYPDLEDEDEKYQVVSKLNDRYLDDERHNLSKEFSDNIVIIADIGLWKGRRKGYREIGNVLSDCFRFEKDCNYAEWFIDGHRNLRSRQTHNDGTHYLLYRVWKEGVTETMKDHFLDLLYYGKAKSADISRYTRRLGDQVYAAYGMA